MGERDIGGFMELVQGGADGEVVRRVQAFDPRGRARRTTIPEWLLCRVEVTLAAKIVYAAMTGYFNEATGYTVASNAELATATGLSTAQVVRAITELRNDRLIWRIEGFESSLPRYRFIRREWMENNITVTADLDDREA